ncbi:unnamed protein product [Schistosoma rodhaini]|uniref:Tetraspanin n=1 Tax=Schistosoma rodhaini TaxID=6188 RepID=A0AA85G793_9TREM|nr:unnamed protein product [Schistosoma rodhaini]
MILLSILRECVHSIVVVVYLMILMAYLFLLLSRIRSFRARAIIHETLKEGVEDWKNSNNEVRWMDAIHVMFQCCGYNGPTDYGIAKVPSCCLNDECTMDFALLSFQTGCKERIDNIMHNFLIICISVITIALIELIGLIFAMTLCCAVNGRDPNAYYRAVQTA